MSFSPSQKMSPAFRSALIWVFGLLWVTGCLWLVLHFVFEQRTDFGVIANPWEPTAIRVHGLLAVAGVFMLGWITSQHVIEALSQARNRGTGISLAAIGAILVLSGYALYYVTGDTLRGNIALLHEAIGAPAIFIAVLHWRKVGARDPSRRDIPFRSR